MTESGEGQPCNPGSSGPLTPFQIEVARAFFDLPEASGFLLAGGAALAAQGLTTRPTQDLDLFTSPGRGVVADAVKALEASAVERGWSIRRARVSDTFARLVVDGTGDSVVVDVAVDATPERPAMMSVAGPTLDPEELAGRKVVALFDRAEARDFADVHALAARYSPEHLIDLAARIDAGFDIAIFADMLESHRRFSDDEIPSGDAAAVRAFAERWAQRLRQTS
jgi:nucleotide-binding universal stress UspA family protein